MIRRTALACALIVAALLWPFDVSNAKTLATTADLLADQKASAYIFSRPLLEMMYRLGVEQDKKLGLEADCKSQYEIKPSFVVLLKPMEFSEDKLHPVQGVWMTRYQLTRCGDSKFYNALFLANLDGEAPMPKASYPGSSDAGPTLVDNAMMSAVTVALARSGLKDCKTVDVFDMRVTEPAHEVVEGEQTFERVWSEMWTFRMCGQMTDVRMTFIRDPIGNGYTFRADPVRTESAAGKP